MIRLERNGYFGKLPARSDFIKDAQDVALMGVLDDWLAQVMTRLPAEPRWKLHYDALAPVSFAFVGPHRRHALAGHIVASRDQSGRRFPFLMMRTLEVADPAGFVAVCPLVLAPLWSFFEHQAPKVMAAADPTVPLQEIPDTVVALAEHADTALATFLDTATIASLGALLGVADPGKLILALGMLLQPVMQSGDADLEKSLVLPLPENPSARAPVAALWLALISPFLRRADFDLALFITRQHGQPVLVLGFCGAAAHTLHAIIDPQAGQDQQIDMSDTAWVDEQLGVDVDVRALASYLDQPQLPLKLARELFLQTFIGEAP
ncbi:MAG: type VI secretion system-associated protein TagF [Massilia sp.]